MPFRSFSNQNEEGQTPEQNQSAEQPQEVGQENPSEQKGFRRLEFGTRGEQEPKRVGEFVNTGGGGDFLGSLSKGLKKSAAGQSGGALSGAAFGTLPEQVEEKPQGFWESVIQESGTLIGDAPFMAIGAAAGAAVGAVGGPVVAAAGGAFGSMAFPAFLKEASRQYRDFQENGGDLSFGEFIQYDQLMNKTLTEGAFGVVLKGLRGSSDLLRKIPAIDQLFNTKYIGAVAQGVTEIGFEVGGATVIPAAIEGRLPSAEDAARAAVLFTGSRAVNLPGQLHDVIKDSRSERFNYALADQIQNLDLAYPPLQEFRNKANPIYKNSEELDRNLTAFDKSYIENVTSQVNSLSPTEFATADEAGRLMYNRLGALAAVQIAPVDKGTPEPTKPQERPVPLASNPLNEAMVSISGNAKSSKADLGRAITQQYQQGRAAEYEPLQQRYQQQEREVTGLDMVDPDFVNELQTFIDRFEPGAIPGSQAAVVVANARRLMEMFVQRDAEGEIAGYTAVPMRNVIQTNRSIKQIPNWDVPPEMLDNLDTLTRNVDQTIAGQLGNVNEELGLEYERLNGDYALFKNRWDNADMRMFYDRTENSEKVANRFSNLDEFTQLSQAIGGNYQGQRVLNQVRRDVWKDRIGRDALNAKTEGQFEEATRDFTREKLRDMMQFLTPEQREVANQAYNRSNQVRTSAIRSAEQFSQDKYVYDRQMKQWKENETSRNEKNKKAREEVQTKQELLISLLQQDPSKLVGNMKTIEGIRRIKSATEKVENGKELYDSLARYETEQMFDFMKEGYVRTGRVPYTQMKINLQNKEYRGKLKELNGESFVKDMDELVDLTDKLSKGFKEKVVEYKNDPTTLNTILHIYALLGLAQGNIMTPLMAFTAKKNLLRIGTRSYNMWTNKRNYDQQNIHRVLNSARAANKGNKAEIRRQEALMQLPYQSP